MDMHNTLTSGRLILPQGSVLRSFHHRAPSSHATPLSDPGTDSVCPCASRENGCLSFDGTSRPRRNWPTIV